MPKLFSNFTFCCEALLFLSLSVAPTRASVDFDQQGGDVKAAQLSGKANDSSAVPESITMLLFGTGLTGAAAYARRRRALPNSQRQRSSA